MISGRILLFFLLVLLTVARFGLALQNHPTPAEAYVWMKGQQPDWGYVEGPPGAPVLARGLTDLLGPDAGLALMGPLAALAASLGLWLFARRCTNEPVAAIAVITLNAIPAFNLASVTAGSTAPALAFGFLAMAGFSGVIMHQGPTLGWVLAGLMIGAGVYFDFSLLWLIPAFLLYIATSQESREEFLRPGLYLAIALILVCILPLWQWNQANDGVWGAAGTLRSTLAIPFSQTRLLLAKAFLGLSPLLACVALGTVLYEIKTRSRLPFLLLTVVPAIGWMFTPPLSDASSILLLLASAPVFCEAGKLFTRTHYVALRMTAAAALLLATLFTGASLFARRPMDAAAWKWTANHIRQISLKHLDTNGVPAFTIASTPELAATLAYYAGWKNVGPGSWPPIFVRESAAMESQFALWPRYDDFKKTAKPPDELFGEMTAANPFLGRDAFFISMDKPEDLPTVIRSGFEVVAPISGVEFTRNGHVQRRLEIYLCTSYQTVPL